MSGIMVHQKVQKKNLGNRENSLVGDIIYERGKAKYKGKTDDKT